MGERSRQKKNNRYPPDLSIIAISKEIGFSQILNEDRQSSLGRILTQWALHDGLVLVIIEPPGVDARHHAVLSVLVSSFPSLSLSRLP